MQNSSAFQYLAIDTIRESTTNPRRTFDEGKLLELAESIKHHGLIQPVTVRPNSEGFELIAGARRYRAAQLAELFSIPARIVEIDDTQALEWQLVELSIVGKSFLCIHAADTLFICKRRAGPRIGAPGLGASPGRVNLPLTPFSIRRLFAATRVGLMLFPERSSCTNDG